MPEEHPKKKEKKENESSYMNNCNVPKWIAVVCWKIELKSHM